VFNLLATVFQDNQRGFITGEPTGSKPSHYGDILRFMDAIGEMKAFAWEPGGPSIGLSLKFRF